MSLFLPCSDVLAPHVARGSQQSWRLHVGNNENAVPKPAVVGSAEQWPSQKAQFSWPHPGTVDVFPQQTLGEVQ